MSRKRQSRGRGARRGQVSAGWRTRLPQIGLALLCVEVLLVPVVFDRAALQVFVLPKALAIRSIGVLLIGVLAVMLVLEGRRLIRWSPTHVGVLSFAIAYIAATVAAQDKSVALVGAHDRLLGLITVMGILVVYVASAVLLRSKRDYFVLGSAFASGAVVVLAYALIQWLDWDPYKWAADPSFIRTFSTIGNPTTLGHYLTTVALMLLSASLLAPMSRRTRVVTGGLGALLLFGAATTGTRAVILGVLFGGMVAAALAWGTQPTLRRRAALTAGYGLAAIGFTVLLLYSPIGSRLASFAGTLDITAGPSVATQNVTLSSRLVLYEVALQQVAERPVFGQGPDNYSVAFPGLRGEGATRVLGTTAPETSPHSWILKIATDAGLLGIGAISAVLTLTAVSLVRSRWPWPAAVAFVTLIAHLATGTVTVTDVSTEWIPWLSIGVIVSATYRDKLSPDRASAGAELTSAQSARPLLGVGVAIIAVATIVLSASSFRPWEASRAAETARRARGHGDHALAQASSVRAVSLDGQPAAYWHGLGLSFIGLNAPERAVEAFGAAVDREPYNASYLGSLARAQLLLGQSGNRAMRDRALDTAGRALREDPFNPESHFTLGLVQFVLGRFSEAAGANERALSLRPPRLPDESVPNAAARAYLALGRPGDAERWARLGLMEFEGSVTLKMTLAQSLAAGKKFVDALAVINEVLAVQPNDAASQKLRDDIARAISQSQTLASGSFEDDDNRIQYEGTWYSRSVGEASGGRYLYSNVATSYFRLEFRGSRLTLVGLRGPDRGIAEVFIDGQLVGEIDGFEEEVRFQVPRTFHVPSGLHQLRVQVGGRKSPNASNSFIDIDRVDVE